MLSYVFLSRAMETPLDGFAHSGPPSRPVDRGETDVTLFPRANQNARLDFEFVISRLTPRESLVYGLQVLLQGND